MEKPPGCGEHVWDGQDDTIDKSKQTYTGPLTAYRR